MAGERLTMQNKYVIIGVILGIILICVACSIYILLEPNMVHKKRTNIFNEESSESQPIVDTDTARIYDQSLNQVTLYSYDTGKELSDYQNDSHAEADHKLQKEDQQAIQKILQDWRIPTGYKYKEFQLDSLDKYVRIERCTLIIKANTDTGDLYVPADTYHVLCYKGFHLGVDTQRAILEKAGCLPRIRTTIEVLSQDGMHFKVRNLNTGKVMDIDV